MYKVYKMASTRNKNTACNYSVECNQTNMMRQWTMYSHGAAGNAYDPKLAGIGLLQGHVPNTLLSNNATDVESFLYGIGSTNLVNPSGPLTPELKYVPNADIYTPKKIVMPICQAIPKNQRPFPV